MRGIEEVAGAVTAVTGFEKGSGKTTFLDFALPYARTAGPVALFSIGVDGGLKAKGHPAGGPGGEIRVEPGDLVLTTEAFARASSARFEVLEALPGRTALGPLLLGRARRAGSVTLVGPEHLGVLAQLLERVRQEGWAASALVDGSVNRITQVNALGDVQFVFCARVDPASLERTAARIRALAALAALPVQPEPGAGVLRLEGPVTGNTLKDLPNDQRPLSVEDFTKFFLEPAELLRTLERRPCSLRRRLDLLCCAVATRGLGREQLLRAVGEQAAAHILFNPYQVAV